MADTEKVKAWVEALRSGEYPQSRYTLRHALTDVDGNPYVEGYCCLGVACEVAIKDGLGVTVAVNDSGYQEEGTGYTYTGALPPMVLRWLGIEDISASGDITVHYVDEGGVKASNYLASLNDDHMMSFQQIADIIEDNFLKGEGE